MYKIAFNLTILIIIHLLKCEGYQNFLKQRFFCYLCRIESSVVIVVIVQITSIKILMKMYVHFELRPIIQNCKLNNDMRNTSLTCILRYRKGFLCYNFL